MTGKLEQVVLPQPVEDALSRWAHPTPDPGAFAEQLERTLLRVHQTPIGSTADNLLAAPDLEDAEARAELPSFDDELPAPMQSGEHLRLEVAKFPAVSASQRPHLTASRYLWLLGVGSAAAAALVLVFGMERPPSSTTTVVVTNPDSPTPTAPTVPTSETVPAESNLIHSVASLGSVESAPPRAQKGTRSTTAGAASPKPATLIPSEPDLTDEPAMLPAAGPASLVEHPSQGAVAAALARPIARAGTCLIPQSNPISIAVGVTFQADGSVQRVNLPGGLLSAKEESCVRQALLGAKTEPFARSRFEVRTSLSVPASQKPSTP